MECYCYLRNVQDILTDGKTLLEKRFGDPFKGPTILFGAVVEYHPISTRDHYRVRQFEKRVYLEYFLREKWKEEILIVDLEELEKMDASEIHP